MSASEGAPECSWFPSWTSQILFFIQLILPGPSEGAGASSSLGPTDLLGLPVSSLAFSFLLFECLFLYLTSLGLTLQHTGSVVAVCGLSCSTAYGILVPWPGIEPSSPALQGGFLTTGPPGKSQEVPEKESRLFPAACVHLSTSEGEEGPPAL